MEMTAHHPFRSESAKERYLALYEMREKEWPVSSVSQMTDTSYGPTFVRISGPSGALPLVLLPGAASTSLMWLPSIRRLSGRFRTYAVDNVYDYGRSVWTRAIKGPDEYAAWLGELLTGLGLEDGVRLLGMSYGGWLACLCALRFPERLDRVVALAPAATVLPVRPAFMLRAALTMLPCRVFTRSFIYWLFGDSVGRNGSGSVFLDGLVEEMFTASCSFQRKRFVPPTVLTDGELGGLRCPVLYLVGEREKVYSARKALMRLKKAAPHIEAEIIPRVGHGLTMEESGAVMGKVVEFLERDPGQALWS